MMALGYPAVAPILGRPAGRVFLASRARLARTVTGLGGRAYGRRATAVRCCEGGAGSGAVMRTCKNCKGQFDPSLNHPRACRFHTAHFGGETKRKFESVYVGGTLDTPDSGKVFQYWHCCGSENPFDPGCTAAPHSPYDD